jgi:hypothetical protein
MGECNYSIVARFRGRLSDKKKQAIKEFFAEGILAEDYWQRNRGNTSDNFWPGFTFRFPVVSEYLRTCAKINTVGGDCHNSLAGLLDFGSEDYLEYMYLKGNTMTYEALVWHMANWGPLANFIKIKFGAETVWIGSEENGDSVATILLEMDNQRLRKEVRRLRQLHRRV